MVRDTHYVKTPHDTPLLPFSPTSTPLSPTSPKALNGCASLSSSSLPSSMCYVTSSSFCKRFLHSRQPEGQLSTSDPLPLFCNDVPPERATPAIKALRYQAERTSSTPSGPPAWPEPYYDGRGSYAEGILDPFSPPARQNNTMQ